MATVDSPKVDVQWGASPEISNYNDSATTIVDTYAGEINRIVNDFTVDAVILPAHRGYKDINAALKIIRDMCKHIDVPFTTVGCDMFEERVMTVDEIVEKMGFFFESALPGVELSVKPLSDR